MLVLTQSIAKEVSEIIAGKRETTFAFPKLVNCWDFQLGLVQPVPQLDAQLAL